MTFGSMMCGHRPVFVMLFATLALYSASTKSSLASENPAVFQEWKHSGSMWLLTTPDGADLAANAAVEGFPLLVRLHKDFFDFRQTKSNGADLRFSSSTGEPLAYQIEDWDAVKGEASVWVRVPKILGNERQELKLHWGNIGAVSESNGKAVFNESNGYLSVWHMNDPVQDEVGKLACTDTGTTSTSGMIGASRYFSDGKGVFCGDMIPSYPTGSSSHSTEAWFRAENPNGRVLAWGNEHAQGKVVMHYVSPPHVKMECYFSGADVSGKSTIPISQWVHVVHTYEKGDSRVYVNGVLDGTMTTQSAPLAIKSPARMFLGGWYGNYDFVGALDEVRISNIKRSAEWIKLQYENQRPNQTLVGPLVQPGDASSFLVSQTKIALTEGQSETVTAKAGGAQKVYWILKHDGKDTVVASDRFSFTFDAGRVVGSQTASLTFKAIYANEVKTKDIAITISEDIPEPLFTLSAPTHWDGLQTIEIAPQITNFAAMRAKEAGNLRFNWTVDGIAVIKQVEPGKLILKRAQGSGQMRVEAEIDNGGEKIVQSIQVTVKEPSAATEPWIPRPLSENEQPEDNQFIARENFASDGPREGTLVYAGMLTDAADLVFVRVFEEDQLFATQTSKLTDGKKYSLSVKLKAALVKYRTEFGSKSGDRETVLHTASNLVCGDVLLISGQSNAVANDFGKENSLKSNPWVRTFGATDSGPQGSRLKLWAPAEARSPGGKSEIGYWGMELGRLLVESEKIPICIINGAVGGTRIDQHQRNEADPTDVKTIYGRLLWRLQQAKLTHGIRAVLWHQGENDQGADGPTGGYGYETYRQFFIDLAASWKQDYPNIQRYYVFQIWPKACSMGIKGSDNKLREVQRKLPALFSNLSVMSTLGIKPPGGCHFPAAGYAEFARLLTPMMLHQLYNRHVNSPYEPPNLQRAFFSTVKQEELILEFDQQVVWSDALASQFHLDGEPKQVASGSASSNRITLKLKSPSKAMKVTYLDSASWNPDNLLYGQNGLAALTFCDVPIEPKQ